MSREIKFRAWDKTNNRMISWESMQCWMMGSLEHDNIMQFTGLKDKNDKEIYESDILKYADLLSDNWLVGKEKIVGIVNWIEHRCSFQPQEIEENHKGGHYIALWDSIDKVEVIGNIYENPELLEQQK